MGRPHRLNRLDRHDAELKKGTILLSLICAVLAACLQVEMRDVTSDPKYSTLVGERLRLRQEAWATAISTDANYAPKVDYVVLVPGPGFTGPEVVSRTKIEIGAEFRILRILRSTRLAASRTAYVVEPVGQSSDDHREMRVAVTSDVEEPNLGLDVNVFEIMPR